MRLELQAQFPHVLSWTVKTCIQSSRPGRVREEVTHLTLTEYECTQKQREYERKIRASKTLLAGYDAAAKAAPNATLENAMKEDFSSESVNLKRIEAEMKDFCRQTGRAVDSARTQVYAVKDQDGKIINFGRSTSQKAVWANRKAR